MRPLRLLTFLSLLALVAIPLLQADVHAQGRAVRRAATPRPGGVVVGAYYRPLFISPFYYNAFYDPWWYPYASPYPYGWYGPYAYGGRYDDTAGVRLQVTPKETEVFVDGYYAGTVDQFDGMFQRLYLEPGEHELTLYLNGHHSVTQKIFLQDRGTFRIRHTMAPLAPGDPQEARPVATSTPPRAARQRAAQPPPRQSPQDRGTVRGDSNFGAISIRVQPADADVLIDGERWEGPAGSEALIVQVVPGTHRIEVRKDGYRMYSAEVNVTAAQTSPVNISLPKQ